MSRQFPREKLDELLTHPSPRFISSEHKPTRTERDGEALLAELLHEVAERLGRIPSRSTVFRALLRLVQDFDGVLLTRLAGLIGREENASRPREKRLSSAQEEG